MAVIHRTGPNDPRLRPLVEELDRYLRDLDGDVLHQKVSPYNRLEPGTNVLIAELNGEVVGCGALRSLDKETAEIKRMFVRPTARGNKIGAAILTALEDWARELGHTQTILETVPYLESAVALYSRSGYARIPNYPPYDAIAESICFAKSLEPKLDV
ncbi:MAG: hypothetical protein HONBIEJF_00975 [Fimbriimonadaceae bacterium]|nr:hypothetical protein [Fimbriimonadaceae bacterium]